MSVPGTDLRSVMMDAKAAGKRVANITDVDVTDATPAAMGASINDRNCQGPTNMGSCPAARKVNGGKGSIAEQMVDNGFDVVLGGGRARFTQNVDAGGTLLARATGTLGYRDVSTKQGLAAIDSLAGGPVLGLFASGYMTTKYAPLIATAAGSGSTTYRCQPNNRGDEPTLAEMTTKALQLVDNPNGFFMQVESAQTDKGAHDGNICGSLGQVSEADKALEVLLEFQRTHPDTLIVVTADHGHATQIVRPARRRPTARCRPRTAAAARRLQHVDHEPVAHRRVGADRGQGPAGGQRQRDARPDRRLRHPQGLHGRRGGGAHGRDPGLADAEKPKNTVVLLLDGFDHQLMTAARDYELGADGRFLFDELPFWGQMTTHGLLPGAGPDVRDQLRQRLGGDRDRVGDRAQDDRGPDQPGPEHGA